MRFIAPIMALIAGACATQPVETTAPTDAIVTNASADVTAEIQSILSMALSRRVTVASNVLVSESKLIIDPPFNDRSLARPDHFVLQMTGEHCALYHSETGKRYRLKTAKCVPV